LLICSRDSKHLIGSLLTLIYPTAGIQLPAWVSLSGN